MHCSDLNGKETQEGGHMCMYAYVDVCICGCVADLFAVQYKLTTL